MAILNQLTKMVTDAEKEAQTTPNPPYAQAITLRKFTVEKLAALASEGVLIDGGTSHNVYYSGVIPKGAIEREVELAYGSKTGYVLEDDIIFLDESMEPDEGRIVCIISLGRFTNYGAKVTWDKQGAYLTVPGGKEVKLKMYNNCPHASSEIVEKLEELKAEDYKNRRVKKLMIRLVTAHKLKLKTQKELDDHRRGGHAQYSPDCPKCKEEQRRRDHTDDFYLGWEEN